MDDIRKQVLRARRRLILQQFLAILPWSLFVALLVSVIALAVPKIWPLPIVSGTWAMAWVLGSLAAGLLAALVWTYVKRFDAMDAALEIDRRFGLKERLSSTLSLSAEEQQTEVGRALIEDTAHRAARLDVVEKFGVSAHWRTALPLLPALAVFALLILPNAVRDGGTTEAAAGQTEVTEQIKRANEELKRRIEQRRQEAEAKGLEDAEMLFKKLQANLDQMNSQSELDRRQAMVQLNDLKKQLEERRRQLGTSSDMKQQLDQLKQITSGPADRAAQAIRQGDFGSAVDEMRKLAEQLKKGELSEQEQQELAEQLSQMKERLEELVQAHEQAKRQLEERIRDLERQGDLAEASKLQQRLDQLRRQDQQMQRLQDLAQQLGECSSCLSSGQGQQAAEGLESMMAELQAMQSEMDELQTLEDVMDQIADARNAMDCGQCDGGGCQGCRGDRMGNAFEQAGGDGIGDGRGFGDGPHEEIEAGTYDSQVRAQPQPGQAVVAGTADGPNRPGMTREEIKQEMESSLRAEADPLSHEPLPRQHRDHAREYFERFRRGQ